MMCSPNLPSRRFFDKRFDGIKRSFSPVTPACAWTHADRKPERSSNRFPLYHILSVLQEDLMYSSER